MRSFTATTSLDVLEHVPPANRAQFVAEMLRVTERRSVLCCPLGSPEHDALEAEIDDWYRQLTGDGHPWLREHLEHGLPTLPSLEALYEAAGADVQFRFHGDARVTGHQFRTAVLARRRHRPADLARYAALRLPYRPADRAPDDADAVDESRVRDRRPRLTTSVRGRARTPRRGRRAGSSPAARGACPAARGS